MYVIDNELEFSGSIYSIPSVFYTEIKKGLFMLPATGNRYSEDKKIEIVNDAKQLILDGYNLQQIADKHGIHKTSLSAWLQALGEEYEDIRKAWIDGMLAQASEDIETAGLEQIQSGEVGQAQFFLARARETWKKATWYAERRDTRYSPVQQQASITLNLVPPALQSSASLLLDSITTVQVQDETVDTVGGDTNLSEDVDPPG